MWVILQNVSVITTINHLEILSRNTFLVGNSNFSKFCSESESLSVTLTSCDIILYSQQLFWNTVDNYFCVHFYTFLRALVPIYKVSKTFLLLQNWYLTLLSQATAWWAAAWSPSWWCSSRGPASWWPWARRTSLIMIRSKVYTRSLQDHYGDQTHRSFSGWLPGEIWVQARTGAAGWSFIIFRFDNDSLLPSLISWLIAPSWRHFYIYKPNFSIWRQIRDHDQHDIESLSECLKFPELGSWRTRKDIQFEYVTPRFQKFNMISIK